MSAQNVNPLERKPRLAAHLPVEILEVIFEGLNQSDRLAFCRASRDWYITGYPLMLEALDFTVPVLGGPEPRGHKKRMQNYRGSDVKPKILTVHDPVRRIEPVNWKVETPARLTSDISHAFPIQFDLLSNIRELRIHSQLVSLYGPKSPYYDRNPYHGHSWAYDIIPRLLHRCPQVDILDVEIIIVKTRHEHGTCGNWGTSGGSPNEVPRPPRNALDLGPADWFREDPSRPLKKRGGTMQYQSLIRQYAGPEPGVVQPNKGLSKLAVTVSGKGHYDELQKVLRTLGHILGGVYLDLPFPAELRIRNLLNVDSRDGHLGSLNWELFTHIRDLEAKNLRLEFGERGRVSLPYGALPGEEWNYQDVESLCIDRYGRWTQEQLEQLDGKSELKHLHIIERVQRELTMTGHPAPPYNPKLHKPRVLFTCMETLLFPKMLKTITWQRYKAGHKQEVFCTITRNPDWDEIEHVEISLTCNGVVVMDQERYDAKRFHQELFDGFGKSTRETHVERWGTYWAARFGSRNIRDIGIDVDRQAYRTLMPNRPWPRDWSVVPRADRFPMWT
ncbi:hypothetical protein TWF696_000250 [Orbilia brochopaga]|uniref:F-box domain-containing protein n=1 Tax=Orbilia brochopaga TaxID=3140254 RepID=A0AAV9VAR4_9PEZI